MTPNDLIKLALRQIGVVGVGQTPQAEDVNDAFSVLNMMLAQWNRKRWLVFHLVDSSLVATGAQSYTVGPGGNFNIQRPDRIESAFVRNLGAPTPNRVDYPLQVIDAYEDYANIALKTQPGFPQIVFLDTGPLFGTVYFWPVPGPMYELHLIFKAELAGFATIADTINLPKEYEEAMLYNLDGRLRPLYGKAPDPSIVALARASLNTVRMANTQVPLLRMPPELPGRGVFNIYTGDSRSR
jgi:hypothetical protein